RGLYRLSAAQDRRPVRGCHHRNRAWGRLPTPKRSRLKICAGRVLLCQWQCEGKDRAAVGRVAHRDEAVMSPPDLVADGQAETRSPRRPGTGGVEANESFED